MSSEPGSTGLVRLVSQAAWVAGTPCALGLALEGGRDPASAAAAAWGTDFQGVEVLHGRGWQQRFPLHGQGAGSQRSLVRRHPAALQWEVLTHRQVSVPKHNLLLKNNSVSLQAIVCMKGTKI